jgi:hypothetical protein
LTSLLKRTGHLFPTTEEEVKEFDKLLGNTEIILPNEVDDPKFILDKLKELSLKKNRELIINTSASKEDKLKIVSLNDGITKKSVDKNKDYFKKLVLAAEVASQLFAEPTFGRTKFVKVLYLCEQVCQMQLSTNYGKYAAGPFDPKFIFSVEAEFKNREWFEVIKKDSRTKYLPSKKIDSYKTYFFNYYQNKIDSINRVINLFRPEKTDFCEIVATIFSVWKEELLKKAFITDDILVDKFYSWSKQKERFAEHQIIAAIEWMKSEQIVPFV